MQLCTFESRPSVKASQLAAVIWHRMAHIQVHTHAHQSALVHFAIRLKESAVSAATI